MVLAPPHIWRDSEFFESLRFTSMSQLDRRSVVGAYIFWHHPHVDNVKLNGLQFLKAFYEIQNLIFSNFNNTERALFLSFDFICW